MQTISVGSTGPDVRLAQSLLNRIGYNAGPVDGVFGSLTYRAVIAFQRNNGLAADGIVGPATWNVMTRLIRGYDTYTVRPGDTLYRIARAYYTTVNAIVTANPGIDPDRLSIGQRLTVPYGIDVTLDVAPTYEIVGLQVRGLKAGTVPGNRLHRQECHGRELYYVRLGREAGKYRTMRRTMRMNQSPRLFLWNSLRTIQAYSTGGSIQGYNIRNSTTLRAFT